VSRCLGARAAALADGMLGPAEAERALAHVAACPRCRADLLAQREMRALLRGLSAPQVPGDVVASVSGIPVRPLAAPTPGLVPPPPLGGAAPLPLESSPHAPRPFSLVPRRPGPVVASVAAVTVSAGLSLLAASPQAAVSVPRVAPDAASFVADHRAAASASALTSPALRSAEIGVPATPGVGGPASRSFASAASAASVLAVVLDPGSRLATSWTSPSRTLGARVAPVTSFQGPSAHAGPVVAGSVSLVSPVMGGAESAAAPR
jgi:hypothetical protein